MKRLKVCFIGVGSIAKRHIKNLREIAGKEDIQLIIDACSMNRSSLYGIETVYRSIDELPADYGVVFITNPTSLHLDTLLRVHDKGVNFFIEKPVVDIKQIVEAENFRLRSESVYYVACPLRYNAVIQWIKDNIDPAEVISVRSISSSYLPDWRPGQDYRETYSAHKEMGGGASIDLIHEWDYLTYLFGWPQKVHSLIGTKSDLEINSDDYAIYIAEYTDKIVELHLDYFGRKTIREIQLICKDDTIVGDIAGNKVSFLKSGMKLDFKEERDDYHKRELMHFLNMIAVKSEIEDGYHNGLMVLNLTQGRLQI